MAGDGLIKCLLHPQACVDRRQESGTGASELALGGGPAQTSAPSVSQRHPHLTVLHGLYPSSWLQMQILATPVPKGLILIIWGGIS